MYNDFALPTPWGSVPSWLVTLACAAVMVPAIFMLTKSLSKRQKSGAGIWLVVIICLPFVGASVYLVQHWIGTILRGKGPRGGGNSSGKAPRPRRGS